MFEQTIRTIQQFGLTWDFRDKETSELTEPLSRFERLALALGRISNERPLVKRLGMQFTKMVTYNWVYRAIGPRVYVEGIERLAAMNPDRGVVVVANHRSFFDMYSLMLSFYGIGGTWVERFYFPVRANFFYEHPLGVALNFSVGAGAMYPPIYRDTSRSALNKDAIDRVCRLLRQPGTLVGLHPEGTRGKGPDPYHLLPAQPGVGQIVLQAKPIVVPFFVNGLPNDARSGIVDTYRKDARRNHPIIIVIGDDLDYSEFTTKKPRVALYKHCADKMNQTILQLGEREREIRDACARGDVSDDDCNWLSEKVKK
ncbi:MAG: 1-acyl-sn-glycerol-3-phosphate acyltransferase [Proteobacteria bacterium]|nr:1-acyl-sn-glycerol-3-phosphate acyltransferase [Pseudomonadota bacterium]